MPWVKLDSSRSTNRKMRAAGFAARGLDEAAMCQVAEDGVTVHRGQDAFIEEHTVAWLAGAHRCSDVSALTDTLCSPDVNRWERNDDPPGFWIHDFLVYNKTKEEWDTLVARRRDSGRAGGGARSSASATDADAEVAGATTELAKEEAKPQANEKQTRKQKVKPLSSSFTSSSSSVEIEVCGKLPSSAIAADFELAWRSFPRKQRKRESFAAYQARLKAGATAEELQRATENYALARQDEDPKYHMHGASFFGPNERWRDYLDWNPPPTPLSRNMQVIANGVTRLEAARRASPPRLLPALPAAGAT